MSNNEIQSLKYSYLRTVLFSVKQKISLNSKIKYLLVLFLNSFNFLRFSKYFQSLTFLNRNECLSFSNMRVLEHISTWKTWRINRVSVRTWAK